MEQEKDKVVITLTLTREENGTITTFRQIEGSGIHLYELVGLLNMTAYSFAKDSWETAKEIPKDQPTKIKYKTE